MTARPTAMLILIYAAAVICFGSIAEVVQWAG